VRVSGGGGTGFAGASDAAFTVLGRAVTRLCACSVAGRVGG
jgi:hypothetical protein